MGNRPYGRGGRRGSGIGAKFGRGHISLLFSVLGLGTAAISANSGARARESERVIEGNMEAGHRSRTPFRLKRIASENFGLD
jgi:hypothetical protein